MKIRNVLITVLVLFVCFACSKSSDSPRTGGGDGSVTISGTINVAGVTLTIRDDNPEGKILFESVITGLEYSAKFSTENRRISAFMLFSKSGCITGGKSIGVSPNTNINIGGTTMTCSSP